MAWDFSTEPEFQHQLDWMDEFVTDEVEPLDLLWGGQTYHPLDPDLRAIVDPLKQQVRDRRLWACHLGPELGGQGYGQVKLALMNEILGRSQWAPIIFGTQAPDTGNAEIIAHYGTDGQKEQYLRPLLEGEIFSCYSMTEPQGGSDPALFETTATRDGDEWVINGWKFFSSNARTSSFLIVMAITDPDTDVYRGMSMFLVPTDTPGVEIVRNIGLMGERTPGQRDARPHPLRRGPGCRPRASSGARARPSSSPRPAWAAAGSTTPCARWGMAGKALDMLCERAVSRKTRDGVLADKQSVRDYVADSYIELLQFRLLVMYVAWCIDQGHDHRSIRRDIAAIKVLTPQVLHDVTQRAIQVHGALGVSDEMPLGGMWMTAPIMGLVDGPTEVHRNTVARQVLKELPAGRGAVAQSAPPDPDRRGPKAKYADHPGA